MIAELLGVGAIPVVLVAGADPAPAAHLLAGELRADQVLHLTPDRIEGVVPRQRPLRPPRGSTASR